MSKARFVDNWLNTDLTMQDLESIYKCNYRTIYREAKRLGLPKRKLGRKDVQYNQDLFIVKKYIRSALLHLNHAQTLCKQTKDAKTFSYLGIIKSIKKELEGIVNAKTKN